MIRLVITTLFVMAVQVGLALLRESTARPHLIPDLDLLFALLVGLYAKRERVTSLLIILACSKSLLTGSPLAAVLASYLLVGWSLTFARNLLFRNILPGRLVFAFFAITALRLCLAFFDQMGRGIPWPATELWLLPALVTSLWAALFLPLLCYVPPLSFYMERSRV